MKTIAGASLFRIAAVAGSLSSLFFFPARGEVTLTPLRADLYRDGWIDFNKNGRQDVYENPLAPLDQRLDDLLGQMTVAEKIAQLATLYGYPYVLKESLPTSAWKTSAWKDGIANIDEHLTRPASARERGLPHQKGRAPDETLIWPPEENVRSRNVVQRWFIEETRLGIPVDFTTEGIRGLRAHRATFFPIQLALGATWDAELIAEVGRVEGQEARALGLTNVYSPVVDLGRDPRWGRILECYSEDPYLTTALALRQVRSLRECGVASTAKHFAVYSIPKGGRDGKSRTDPQVAPREMEMLHLWPFEQLVRKADLLGVMVSYNDYDGIPMAASRKMLIDRLRERWGFRGYVVSDSGAVEFLDLKHRVTATREESAAQYLIAGGNVWTNFAPPARFIKAYTKALAGGMLSQDVIDARVRDVLRVKFLLGLFDQPYVKNPQAAARILASQANREVALRAERESLVLLKNANHTLPLAKNLKRILVCGPLARYTGYMTDRYGPTGWKGMSVEDGIRKAVSPGTDVLFAEGCAVTDERWPESEILPEPPKADEQRKIDEAVRIATTADVVVLVVGETKEMVGEAHSRTDLNLTGFQDVLARALVATGKPVVAVLINGRPLTVNYLARNASALLEAWFPGDHGGQVVAEALFGDYNPGGKLPVTFPRSVGQIPFNFPAKPASQAGQGDGPDPNGSGKTQVTGALFPFGYGLSYTEFAYDELSVAPARISFDGKVTVRCKVRNAGTRSGEEVVQLYLQDVVSSVTTYDLNLRGFRRVLLSPGETKEISFELTPEDLELINSEGHRAIEPGLFRVMVGSSSEDLRLTGEFTVE